MANGPTLLESTGFSTPLPQGFPCLKYRPSGFFSGKKDVRLLLQPDSFFNSEGCAGASQHLQTVPVSVRWTCISAAGKTAKVLFRYRLYFPRNSRSIRHKGIEGRAHPNPYFYARMEIPKKYPNPRISLLYTAARIPLFRAKKVPGCIARPGIFYSHTLLSKIRNTSRCASRTLYRAYD